MTLQNYNEMQSFCVDLLVASGVLERGLVLADGSVDMTTADDDLAQCLAEVIDRSQNMALAGAAVAHCEDPRIRAAMLRLLRAPESKPAAQAWNNANLS